MNKDQCFTFGLQDTNVRLKKKENQFILDSEEISKTILNHDTNIKVAEKQISDNKTENQPLSPKVVVDTINDRPMQVLTESDIEWDVLEEEMSDTPQDVTTTAEEILDQDMTTRIINKKPRPRRPKSRATTLRSLLCCILPIDDNFYNVSSCTINAPNT